MIIATILTSHSLHFSIPFVPNNLFEYLRITVFDIDKIAKSLENTYIYQTHTVWAYTYRNQKLTF